MSGNKKITAIALAMFVSVLFVISGCQKDTTVYIPLHPTEITDTVHFTEQIIPILARNCAISGCHISGGHKPDLTADKAYNSLINGNYVDNANPENSIVYKRLTGKLTPAMPLGGTPNPSDINNLILTWIKQGSLKN